MEENDAVKSLTLKIERNLDLGKTGGTPSVPGGFASPK